MRLMGVAPMSNNVVGKRGLMDQRLSNGVVNGEHGSGLSTERDKKFNGATEDGNSGVRGLIQVHESLHISQQQPQGPAIHWERFLPVRSIKVLLVEDDDSTRHVVSALLRNCSYEVTAVSNGLQAWKTLEDPSSHIDLILTEVAMPLLSGIDLLCKIMNHKTHKNIPIIMMSSLDSMGIVFKCLSKGAVDFLVKPIRRNELKNLWQHVWRRCHSSSDSGSESGTHTRKSVKSRSDGASGNNSDSSDENDFGSKGLTVRDGSDNGSGTQSSWTKCPTDIGSPHTASPHNLVVDAPDSTCAQVMHTRPEKLSIRWVHAAGKNCHKQSDHPDDVAIGKDLSRGLLLNMQLEHQPEELSAHLTGKRITKLSDTDGRQLNKRHINVCGKGKPAYNGDETKTTKDQAMIVVDVATDSNSSQAESRDLNTPNGFSVISQTKASSCSKLPSLELSLKRLGGEGDGMKAACDERNVLRHSDLSAFSKYTAAASANQVQTANVGSCSPLDNNSAAMNTETTNNFPSHSNDTPPNQHSNGSNNVNDMGSTNIYLGTKPEAFDKKPESVTGIGSYNSFVLQMLQNNNTSSAEQKISAKTDNSEMVKARVADSEQGFQVDDNQCQLHHHDRCIAHNATVDLQSDYGDLLVKNLQNAARQCVLSNDFGGPAESNTGNYSLDGNAAESDHGSNGQNGSSINFTTGVMNAESGNGAAGSTGVGGFDSKNSGNVVDEGRIALREAALTKFRQKRKERCFEKRVRYHSRQKMAEQRPRIRGQFVRRTESNTKEEKDTQSNNLLSLGNSRDAPR